VAVSASTTRNKRDADSSGQFVQQVFLLTIDEVWRLCHAATPGKDTYALIS
jgi:hypothetical protein